MENWIETRSGKRVPLHNPQPDDIDIEDIGYALANLCRYNGHSAGFLSVAEHSVLVAQRLPPKLRLAGLLHDAAEAYLGDVPSPVKQFLPEYRKMEAAFEDAVYQALGLPDHDDVGWEQVKQADYDALFTEAHFLMPSQGKDWALFQGPTQYKVNYDLKPVCLPPALAYQLFMGMFYELTEEEKRIITLT